MKGGGLVLLWLLVPSIAAAAPASRHASARVCDPQTMTLRKLERVATSFSGPVVPRSPHALPWLSNGGTRLRHSPRLGPSDDAEAIQNDAPAACVDADAGIAFALEPVGLLARSSVRPPKTHDLSPRSPRGPPVAG